MISSNVEELTAVTPEPEPAPYPAIRTDTRTDVNFDVICDLNTFDWMTTESGLVFDISGTGEISEPERCGAWSTAAVCSHDPGHFVRHIKHSCDTPSCPVCMPRWAAKQGTRISERLRGYIEEANHGQMTLDGVAIAQWHKDNTRYLNHYILSPRASEIQHLTIDRIKAAGRAMAHRVGITGGAMMFHPYRIKHAIQQRLRCHRRDVVRMHEEDRDKAFWEMVRGDVLGLGDWRHYIEWSPHYHIIGFGRLLSQRTPEEKLVASTILAGWVVKWVRHVQTDRWFNGQRMVDSIVDLAAYLLSHAAYLPGKKAVAWIGVLSPKYLTKRGNPTPLDYDVACPTCGSPVILGGFDATGTFIPRQDQDGATIPYRIRCCTQQYVLTPGCKPPPPPEWLQQPPLPAALA